MPPKAKKAGKPKRQTKKKLTLAEYEKAIPEARKELEELLQKQIPLEKEAIILEATFQKKVEEFEVIKTDLNRQLQDKDDSLNHLDDTIAYFVEQLEKQIKHFEKLLAQQTQVINKTRKQQQRKIEDLTGTLKILDSFEKQRLHHLENERLLMEDEQDFEKQRAEEQNEFDMEIHREEENLYTKMNEQIDNLEMAKEDAKHAHTMAAIARDRHSQQRKWLLQHQFQKLCVKYVRIIQQRDDIYKEKFYSDLELELVNGRLDMIQNGKEISGITDNERIGSIDLKDGARFSVSLTTPNSNELFRRKLAMLRNKECTAIETTDQDFENSAFDRSSEEQSFNGEKSSCGDFIKNLVLETIYECAEERNSTSKARESQDAENENQKSSLRDSVFIKNLVLETIYECSEERSRTSTSKGTGSQDTENESQKSSLRDSAFMKNLILELANQSLEEKRTSYFGTGSSNAQSERSLTDSAFMQTLVLNLIDERVGNGTYRIEGSQMEEKYETRRREIRSDDGSEGDESQEILSQELRVNIEPEGEEPIDILGKIHQVLDKVEDKVKEALEFQVEDIQLKEAQMYKNVVFKRVDELIKEACEMIEKFWLDEEKEKTAEVEEDGLAGILTPVPRKRERIPVGYPTLKRHELYKNWRTPIDRTLRIIQH